MQPRQPTVQASRDTFRDRQEEGLARVLGWFSVGRGIAEILAPRGLAQSMGIKNDGDLLPAFGFRELATGVGILSSSRPAQWMWGRVAGDLMDLAYLGNALFTPGNDKGRVAAATLAVAGVAALDAFSAHQLGERPARGKLPAPQHQDISLRASVTVNASVDQLYRFWRDVENLPRIMSHLKSVTRLDERRSHWVVTGPGGMPVEWDAEITDDVPNERIAWRSAADAPIHSRGSVTFQSGGPRHGTIVRVDMRYEPPGGTLGAVLAFLFGKEPRQQIVDDLRAFKAFLETGEVPTTRGQASGRGRD